MRRRITALWRREAARGRGWGPASIKVIHPLTKNPPSNKSKKKGELVDQLQLTPPDLSEHERAIFKLLSTDTPQQIDSLVESSKLSISQLTSALLTLEMRELIRALPGKCFVRKL